MSGTVQGTAARMEKKLEEKEAGLSAQLCSSQGGVPITAAINHRPTDSDSSFFWIQGAPGLGVGYTIAALSCLD